MTITPDTEDPRREIGTLCLGGDWASAHGDFAALRHVARLLALHAPRTIRVDLDALAEACITDPARAGALWEALRPRVAARS